MASLIDVVFLLIIFFMTVSQVTRSEAEKLQLPKAQQSKPDDKSQLKRVVVNVRENGRIIMFGSELSVDGMRKLLADEAAQHGTDNIVVLVRADRRTKWDKVATIMQVCKDNGIRRVRVAVIETTEAHTGF